MSKEKSSSLSGRTRNFTAILYPDSVNTPDNWMSVLSELMIPMFISPLHDKDVNLTGEPKKPHYHIILMFDSTKSCEQAKEIFDLVGAVVPPDEKYFKVNSIRGASRYLCHLDNPDKYQYSQDQVTCLCGADYASVIGLASDKYSALTEMEEFCEKYNVVSFFALARYASVHRTDWSRILKDCGSVYMREYLNSRKWSIENGLAQIVDPESGEVLI